MSASQHPPLRDRPPSFACDADDLALSTAPTLFVLGSGKRASLSLRVRQQDALRQAPLSLLSSVPQASVVSSWVMLVSRPVRPRGPCPGLHLGPDRCERLRLVRQKKPLSSLASQSSIAPPPFYSPGRPIISRAFPLGPPGDRDSGLLSTPGRQSPFC
ncbi:hypothetical protein M433DRAFT_191733 [Acidomyces richmondensis BFW]|nr:MAG: hypothetical protein FE78DRAFT_343247 [Acidomyces sp. 'richmondensis']KYG46654.1 hypothetical protein M433DRAFT_191733 [Acidomyces richmondensis BFW]